MINNKKGIRKHSLYSRWDSMKQRCYNKNCRNYKYYGARGIKVCDEWLDKKTGYENFLNWCLDNGYKKELTIDRTDNNGNYEPSNCRFISHKEQQQNKQAKSNIGVDYIYDIRGNSSYRSNYRISIGNGKRRCTKTLEQALKIRLQYRGY